MVGPWTAPLIWFAAVVAIFTIVALYAGRVKRAKKITKTHYWVSALIIFSVGTSWAFLPLIIDNLPLTEARLIATVTGFVIVLALLIDNGFKRDFALWTLVVPVCVLFYLVASADPERVVFMTGAALYVPWHAHIIHGHCSITSAGCNALSVRLKHLLVKWIDRQLR
ncbi:MAG: hypothetical protein HC777_00405 [Hyphomonadaceae bacterium]|nr:hypothetical protein [Hyphomonadaceae bacterium]